ncbi:hypothetical protein Syun_003775 [Stephania yunnanensis]|uniref:Uncharacterized protein n=1 Tax=Stephania yunnanensis TaxID=152371 RepID=A0AAP0L383_9MAGN
MRSETYGYRVYTPLDLISYSPQSFVKILDRPSSFFKPILEYPAFKNLQKNLLILVEFYKFATRYNDHPQPTKNGQLPHTLGGEYVRSGKKYDNLDLNVALIFELKWYGTCPCSCSYGIYSSSLFPTINFSTPFPIELYPTLDKCGEFVSVQYSGAIHGVRIARLQMKYHLLL